MYIIVIKLGMFKSEVNNIMYLLMNDQIPSSQQQLTQYLS